MSTKPLVRRVKPAIHDDSDEEDLESGAGESYSDGDIDGLSAGTSEMDDENSEEYDGTINPTAILSQTSFGTLARYHQLAPHARQAKTDRVFPAAAAAAAAAAVVVKPQVQGVLKKGLTKRHLGDDADDLTPTPTPTPALALALALAPPPARRRPRRSSPPPKRASKSAPAELSSKKPVPRFREAVETNAPKVQDPRFDPAYGTVNERQFAKNYAFLKEYKDTEMDVLRGEIENLKRKRSKSAAEPMGNDREEVLLRKTETKLKSMESQKKTQESKERATVLIAEHKRRERQLVKQGKAPYFLKRSEQKKMLLMDKYSKLGEKDLDRVIERRRKHNATKQRKDMPWARRNAAQ